MKLSISLSDSDVEALDDYVRTEGLASRSAAVQQAIRRLPRRELQEAYAAAWDEWSDSADAEAWVGTEADGLGDAAR